MSLEKVEQKLKDNQKEFWATHRSKYNTIVAARVIIPILGLLGVYLFRDSIAENLPLTIVLASIFILVVPIALGWVLDKINNKARAILRVDGISVQEARLKWIEAHGFKAKVEVLDYLNFNEFGFDELTDEDLNIVELERLASDDLVKVRLSYSKESGYKLFEITEKELSKTSENAASQVN